MECFSFKISNLRFHANIYIDRVTIHKKESTVIRKTGFDLSKDMTLYGVCSTETDNCYTLESELSWPATQLLSHNTTTVKFDHKRKFFICKPEKKH